MPDQAGDLSIRFWGTRGSIAAPGPDTVEFGGNTTCLEIIAGKRRVIVDGGTGLRALGQHIAKTSEGEQVDIYLTHFHWDHIAGIPFFGPAYMDRFDVNFYAGHLDEKRAVCKVLTDQMMAPLFPVPLKVFKGCAYHDFKAGERFDLDGGVGIRTCRLNHPNGACGYRIDYGGRSICVITDTEHVPGRTDEAIAELVEGADIMVYDAMFTDQEYPRFTGWGHSTWSEALRIADLAGVRTVVPFHHDPNHSDGFLRQEEAAAQAQRPGTVFAREGTVLTA
ncbi:MAG: MBL fold metallo-hydrolase [Rhodospirillaceae bacterium]|nr:MBL fold metallo-hydrolase [Rhodospirillaceae bacterium]